MMTSRKLLWFGLVGLGVAALVQACGDDEDGSSSSSSSNATTGSASGGGSSTSTSSAGGGGNTCAMGIDNPCEQCAAAQCTDLAQACADLSTCDANGEPTEGCLALVNCAATMCGGGDPLCVAEMCGDELESAGGINGEGTQAAQALGDCVEMNCAMECMGAGGAGGAGGGG